MYNSFHPFPSWCGAYISPDVSEQCFTFISTEQDNGVIFRTMRRTA